MSDRLHDFGIDIAFPIVPLEAARSPTTTTRMPFRRGSIALVLGEVNRALTQAGESARFFQFADDVSGWETDEPVWLLLTDDERDQLVADGTLRSVPAS